MNDSQCCLCGHADLREIASYRRLKRVTSDCRAWPAGGRLCVCQSCGAVQKPADESFLREIDEIYRGYAIYDQSQGAEQAVFDGSGAAASRSARLLERLLAHRPLGETGRMLDIGCGNGSTLSAFAKLRPRWSLAGTELSDKYRANVEKIAGPGRLFTCPPSQAPGEFELLSLIHVLEHVIEPVKFLTELRPKLAGGGLLLIELPTYRANPFELLIADHRSHFHAQSAARLIQTAGYAVEVLTDQWITRELTILVRGHSAGSPSMPDGEANVAGVLDAVQSELDWLARVVASCRDLAEEHSFGLFGSSIAATWLDSELEQRAAYFVDEDPARVGRTWRGRPIHHPEELADASHVFVPLPGPIARQVSRRLSRPGISFHLPPPGREQTESHG